MYCSQNKIYDNFIFDKSQDFTNKLPQNLHELQTTQSKMECSELELLKKNRDLENCEVFLKCANEQVFV